ncbi:MAG: PHP domain-containing protein [Propioniciclava sp.]
MRIDLHTHSTHSDGTDTPAELVAEAAAAGLDVLALTDHDTFDGLEEARRAAAATGLAVLPGVEISTQFQGRSVHLLGYGCDPMSARLGAELARIREGRLTRIPATLTRLADLGIPLTWADVDAHAHGASVGRPHVADAMVAGGYVANRDEAFDTYLAEGGPAYVERYAAELIEAIGLVHDAGGAAVIAHVWSRGAERYLTEPVLADVVDSTGLEGLEVAHPDHPGETRARLADIADRLGLLTTGSSDYHGAGKTRNPLGAEVTSPEVLRELAGRVESRGGSL